MSIGKQSSNKWTPKEDDKEGQIMMIGMAQTSDLNFLSQQLNLLSYTDKGREDLKTFITREYIKRRYFSFPPTHDLKEFVYNLPTDLDETDKEILPTEEDQKIKIEELKTNKQKAIDHFEQLNNELRNLGLPEIT
jgi:hypothetical protein